MVEEKETELEMASCSRHDQVSNYDHETGWNECQAYVLMRHYDWNDDWNDENAHGHEEWYEGLSSHQVHDEFGNDDEGCLWNGQVHIEHHLQQRYHDIIRYAWRLQVL